MRLFIAEKPSLAAEIAKGLGAPEKKNGYFMIGGDNIVTWAYGHILCPFNPEEYDERYKVWRQEDLPIIPEKWKMKVAPNCTEQFAIIKRLIGEADEIVNAGDPDREGQLLIDEILDYVGCSKTVKRILLNALDEKSVKLALENLCDNQKFDSLKNSAIARSRADWLIGMNYSRVFTIAAKKAGYQSLLKIGRVKTPTMALVVRRDKEIQNFVPINHYKVQIDWWHENGIVKTIWQPNEDCEDLDSEKRLINKAVAENLLRKVKTVAGYGSNAAIQKIEEEQKKEAQRLPYSLSSLQIEAGKKFGYSPQLVLDTMQKLYEKKLTTYPRSDCDFLPENQITDAMKILKNLKEIGQEWIDYVDQADLSIRSRAWNDKKISAHHAIIPTTLSFSAGNLNEEEYNLYKMVSKAYIAQFYGVHTYSSTKFYIECSNEIFTTTGKTIICNGWKDLYKSRESQSQKEEEILPNVTQGEIVKYQDGKIENKITTPPKYFTASTLLKGMKEIHKFVKDPNLTAQLKSVAGIGTEATRAGIIDDLINTGLIMVEKNNLLPSDTAKMMMNILPEEITFPDTTAIWEDQLEQIVNQEISISDFFEVQKQTVQKIINMASTLKIEPPPNSVRCPECGNILMLRKGKTSLFWGCSNYPNCKASFNDSNGKPIIYQCPVCKKGYLKKLKNEKGYFWACNQYPKCKTIYLDFKGKPKKM